MRSNGGREGTAAGKPGTRGTTDCITPLTVRFRSLVLLLVCLVLGPRPACPARTTTDQPLSSLAAGIEKRLEESRRLGRTLPSAGQACLLMERGRFRKALAVLDGPQARPGSKREAVIRLLKASCLLELGEVQLALIQLKRVREDFPSSSFSAVAALYEAQAASPAMICADEIPLIAATVLEASDEGYDRSIYTAAVSMARPWGGTGTQGALTALKQAMAEGGPRHFMQEAHLDYAATQAVALGRIAEAIEQVRTLDLQTGDRWFACGKLLHALLALRVNERKEAEQALDSVHQYHPLGEAALLLNARLHRGKHAADGAKVLGYVLTVLRRTKDPMWKAVAARELLKLLSPGAAAGPAASEKGDEELLRLAEEALEYASKALAGEVEPPRLEPGRLLETGLWYDEHVAGTMLPSRLRALSKWRKSLLEAAVTQARGLLFHLRMKGGSGGCSGIMAREAAWERRRTELDREELMKTAARRDSPWFASALRLLLEEDQQDESLIWWLLSMLRKHEDRLEREDIALAVRLTRWLIAHRRWEAAQELVELLLPVSLSAFRLYSRLNEMILANRIEKVRDRPPGMDGASLVRLLQYCRRWNKLDTAARQRLLAKAASSACNDAARAYFDLQALELRVEASRSTSLALAEIERFEKRCRGIPGVTDAALMLEWRTRIRYARELEKRKRTKEAAAHRKKAVAIMLRLAQLGVQPQELTDRACREAVSGLAPEEGLRELTENIIPELRLPSSIRIARLNAARLAAKIGEWRQVLRLLLGSGHGKEEAPTDPVMLSPPFFESYMSLLAAAIAELLPGGGNAGDYKASPLKETLDLWIRLHGAGRKRPRLPASLRPVLAGLAERLRAQASMAPPVLFFTVSALAAAGMKEEAASLLERFSFISRMKEGGRAAAGKTDWRRRFAELSVECGDYSNALKLLDSPAGEDAAAALLRARALEGLGKKREALEEAVAAFSSACGKEDGIELMDRAWSVIWKIAGEDSTLLEETAGRRDMPPELQLRIVSGVLLLPPGEERRRLLEKLLHAGLESPLKARILVILAGEDTAAGRYRSVRRRLKLLRRFEPIPAELLPRVRRLRTIMQAYENLLALKRSIDWKDPEAPGNYERLLRIASLQVKPLRNPVGARGTLIQVGKMFPRRSAGDRRYARLLEQVEVLERLGRNHESEATIEEASARKAYLEALDYESRLKDPDTAAGIYSRILRVHPDTAAARCAAARLLRLAYLHPSAGGMDDVSLSSLKRLVLRWWPERRGAVESLELLSKQVSRLLEGAGGTLLPVKSALRLGDIALRIDDADLLLEAVSSLRSRGRVGDALRLCIEGLKKLDSRRGPAPARLVSLRLLDNLRDILSATRADERTRALAHQEEAGIYHEYGMPAKALALFESAAGEAPAGSVTAQKAALAAAAVAERLSLDETAAGLYERASRGPIPALAAQARLAGRHCSEEVEKRRSRLQTERMAVTRGAAAYLEEARRMAGDPRYHELAEETYRTYIRIERNRKARATALEELAILCLKRNEPAGAESALEEAMEILDPDGKAYWKAAMALADLKSGVVADADGARRIYARIAAQKTDRALAEEARSKLRSLSRGRRSRGVSLASWKRATREAGTIAARVEKEYLRGRRRDARAAAEALEQYSSQVTTPQDSAFLLMKAAELYRKRLKEPEHALELYDRADEEADALPMEIRGDIMLAKASILAEDLHRYREARAVYADFLEKIYSHRLRIKAMLEAARLDEEHLDDVPRAAEMYTTIAESYPRSGYDEEALFRLARIRRTFYADFNGAVEAYREIIRRFPFSRYADDAQYTIARIYETELGDLAQAKIEYEKLIDTYPTSEWVTAARDAITRILEK